jgi:hypothetical protein
MLVKELQFPVLRLFKKFVMEIATLTIVNRLLLENDNYEE